MKALYLTHDNPCGHDFGIDFFFAGLVGVLGYENVIDWPEKACLHLSSIAERDGCQADGDQCWPKRAIGFDEAVSGVDVAFLAFPPDTVTPSAVEAVAALPESTPVVALDFSDGRYNYRRWFEEQVGRRVALYTKRELPKGETWALPLPLSYPAVRHALLSMGKRTQVIYRAIRHSDYIRGARERIADLLSRWNDDKADVKLYDTNEEKLSPEAYRSRLHRSLVAVSYNGPREVWDCNRHWEALAAGCCLVVQRPMNEIPNAPQDGVHWFEVDSPVELATKATELIQEQPQLALNVAVAGHEHFMRYHTSEARAQYVLDELRKAG